MKNNFARSYAKLYLQMLSEIVQNIINRHHICLYKCVYIYFLNTECSDTPSRVSILQKCIYYLKCLE